MRKVQTSRNRSDDETTDRMVCPVDDINDEVETLAIGRQSISNAYLDWCYHFSTDWIPWYLVGNTSEDEDRKTEDVGSTPVRVDSGISLHLLGQGAGRPSRTAASASPTPITLLFRFEDATTAKHVPYPAFSNWSAINTLFSEMALDGIIVHTLWDVTEDMPIGSGDWDARIQPGSAIEAWCFNDKRSYHSDDFIHSSGCESDDEMVESHADGYDTESEYRMSWKSSAKETRNEHTWWFTRWRQRVEKAIPGRKEALDEPSWLFMVVWCTATITIIALLILLNQ